MEGLDRIFILCGLPRSGTTYLAALLYNPPEVITLSEAGGKWKQFYREHGVDPGIFDLLKDFRKRILDGEEMATFEGTAGFEGKGRVDTWNQKKEQRKVDALPDFHLGLKNPEIFLAYLGMFAEAGLKCIVTVRHPAAVINSWVKKVQKKLDRGKSVEGKFANGDCLAYSSKSDDIVQRRIDLYNHLAGLVLEHKGHDNVMVIRHEDWYTDPTQLERVTGFLGIPSLGYLRPAPIKPDPPVLSAQEQERINKGCTIAAKLRYPIKDGALEPVTGSAQG
ncbi:MAG: sulfotransferase [Thermodesulfovibrionales bacterium]|nr:sulfotransferase [Thermodesulfovibrionales bacterium]